MSTSPITSHVLDTSLGRPAQGVRIELHLQGVDGSWEYIGSDMTNPDGRVKDLCPAGHYLQSGVYRVTFHTGEYFAAAGAAAFYPVVEVVFQVTEPGQHHHIPLLLSRFGYSTYRGS